MHMGEVHRVLVGKPEGKRPLGRPRHRWEDNIKMDLQEVGGGRGDESHPHCHDTVLRYAVTLQVCTHPKV